VSLDSRLEVAVEQRFERGLDRDRPVLVAFAVTCSRRVPGGPVIQLRFRPIASARRIPVTQKVARITTSRSGQRLEAFAFASALAAGASRTSAGCADCSVLLTSI